MNKSLLQIVSLFLILAFCKEVYAQSNRKNTFFHVKTEGTELPVWVKGNVSSKKFIIYLNGGPGLTSIDVARADMFDWSSGLEKEFAMVYYDQRGCGNAQGNFDQSLLTLSQFVKDLNAIIEVLNTKYEAPQIYLMGHSFGGFIGANYLLTEGLEKKVSGWISVDGAYNFDYALSWQYRRTFLINIAREEIEKGNNPEHWSEALAWTDQTPVIETREHKNKWRAFIGNPGEYIIPEETASLSFRQYLVIGFASSYNPFPSYLSSNLDIVNNRLNEDAEGTNLIQTVSQLTLPTLLLWGRYDDMITPEEGWEVYKNFGTPDHDKFFVRIANSSHEPFISNPKAFQEEIIRFVSKY